MKLELVKKVDEAKDTMSFSFSSEEQLNWEPGQYIYITLPKLNYEDERGDTRHFTISNSPTEKEVRITTRIRKQSGYKKTLSELPIGTIVEGKGPQGTFVFDKTIENNVFLAGGIGITPFRSWIKYCMDKQSLPLRGKNLIHLIYSNSDSDFVFKKELDKWQEENDFLKINYFDTSVSGHLDAQKIKSFCEQELQKSTFWAVGPNVFVNAMEEALEELKIPEDNIKTEKFTGY